MGANMATPEAQFKTNMRNRPKEMELNTNVLSPILGVDNLVLKIVQSEVRPPGV